MKQKTLYIFLILSVLLFMDCLIYYFYQMSFAGYYSDLILFWIWFITGMFIIVLFWERIIIKIFLTVIVLAFIGSILPMMIPFYAFVFSMTSAGLKFDKNLNDKYRVQIVGYGVMLHPSLELIEKKGIFEQKILVCTDMDIQNFKNGKTNVKDDAQIRTNLTISEAKEIFFEKETDSTIMLTLFYGQPNKTLTFDKLTKKLSKIIEE